MLILYLFAGKTMIAERFFLGFTFSSLLIAGMSLYDDIKKNRFTSALPPMLLPFLW